MTILDPCMSLERIKKLCVGSCGYAPASVKWVVLSTVIWNLFFLKLAPSENHFWKDSISQNSI